MGSGVTWGKSKAKLKTSSKVNKYLNPEKNLGTFLAIQRFIFETNLIGLGSLKKT